MDNLTRYHSDRLTPLATEQIDRILPGELSQTLSSLGMDFPQILKQQLNEGLTMELLIKMLRYCPLCHAAISILSLRAVPLLGEYTHPDDKAYFISSLQPRITKQEWIRGNFQSMRGSIGSIYEMMRRQADFFGHSVAEIVADANVPGYPHQWRLTKLKILEIDRYYFAGRGGEIDRIIYYPKYQSPIPIPLAKLLVIYTPSAENPEDLYGDCAAARAYPFYLARQMAYKNWTIAGMVQASGRAIYKVRSEKHVQLYDSRGLPLRDENGQIKTGSAVYATQQMLKGVSNGDPIVLDKDVDVSALSVSGGENFFNTFLTHLQKMVLYCWKIPSTILDDTQSNLGGDGINKGHMMILDSQIKGAVDRDRQEIIEKIFRPLLIANFGANAQSDLGEFITTQFPDPATMGIQLSNIMQATMQGVLEATDLALINKVEALCGLPITTKEEFDTKQMAKYDLEQSQAAEQPPA